jgi:hypothetical protein
MMTTTTVWHASPLGVAAFVRFAAVAGAGGALGGAHPAARRLLRGAPLPRKPRGAGDRVMVMMMI